MNTDANSLTKLFLVPHLLGRHLDIDLYRCSMLQSSGGDPTTLCSVTNVTLHANRSYGYSHFSISFDRASLVRTLLIS